MLILHFRENANQLLWRFSRLTSARIKNQFCPEWAVEDGFELAGEMRWHIGSCYER